MGKGGYGEPDWATPGASAMAGTTQNTGVPAPSGGIVDAATPRDSSSVILSILSACNIGLSVMMAALGVLTLMTFANDNNKDAAEGFLAVYMVLFAILLFTYELMWWMPVPWLNKVLRKNFGFMYGLQGKGLYLVFVAFLCLGLGQGNEEKALTWATGCAYLGFGIAHVLITCVNPELSLKYQAPTAGLLAKEYATTNTTDTPNPV